MKFEAATSFFFASLALISCNKNRDKTKPKIVVFSADDLGYNESELARLKPAPGEPAGPLWGFQPKHMEYIRTQKPKYFELYNPKEDLGQKEDVSRKNPDIVNKMKIQMLKLQSEMIKEGGDWYVNH